MYFFYFWLFPSSAASIPVELSAYTLTLFSEYVEFISVSSVWQWLQLGTQAEAVMFV